MGTGPEELGKKLLITYITKLATQKVQIDAVFCANEAAFLSTSDVDAIKALKALETNGAVISTCGTCLEYFSLKDALQVGQIGSMDLLLQLQQQATKIYQP